LKPGLADAHCNLGNLLGAQKRFEEAAKELRACTQLDPGHLEANLGLGLILMGEGRIAEARAECRKALASPDPGVRDTAQRALEQMGR
jgi:protein O-GlcNAc transferase